MEEGKNEKAVTLADIQATKDAMLEVARIAEREEGTIMGHGTLLERADSILQHGLELKSYDLNTTSVPIFDSGLSPEQQTSGYKKLCQWPHLDSKAIIIIILPLKPDDFRGTIIEWLNYFVQDIEGAVQDGYRNIAVIPSRYLMGYFNANEKKFVRNENFDPQTPTDYPRLGEGLSGVDIRAENTNISGEIPPIVNIQDSDIDDMIW